MKLVEGSVIEVPCAECGKHYYRITLLIGKLTLRCPECRRGTIVNIKKQG